MSESKSEDEMTGDELRQQALERGFVLDDSILDDPLIQESGEEATREHDGDGNADQ